jgi:hypothetical protein
MVSLTYIAAEFRQSVGTTIPQIIDLLKHDNSNARVAGASVLAIFSKRGL